MIRPVSDTAVPHPTRQNSVLSSPRCTRNLLAVSSATVLYTAPRARRGDQLGTDHIIAAAARWYAGWQAVRQIQRRERGGRAQLDEGGKPRQTRFSGRAVTFRIGCLMQRFEIPGPGTESGSMYYTHTSQQPDSKLPPLEARQFRGFANGAGLLLILHPSATSTGRQGYHHDQTPTPCWPRGPSVPRPARITEGNLGGERAAAIVCGKVSACREPQPQGRCLA